MLMKQTALYLPAQLLPAAAQFIQLALWSHFTRAEVIGRVALLVSIQDFMILGLMGFWTSYTMRFAAKPPESEAAAERMRYTSSAVVFTVTALHGVLAWAMYVALIDHHPRPVLIPILMLMVGGRAFNIYQAERARAGGDILLYSAEVMIGPVVGMAVGIALLILFGSDELWIFAGFAVAQVCAALFGLIRDRSWVSFGRPDGAILRHAIGYGVPVIISAVCVWVTQNSARMLVGYDYGLAAAGVYSLGFGLGYRAATIAAMAVTAAAFPLAVRFANAGDDAGAMRQLATNATLLLAVMASSMTGLALVAHDMLHLFVSARMRDGAYPVMLWTLLAGTVGCFRVHFLHQIFLLKAQTKPIATVAVVEAAGTLLLALFVVPASGATGGAIALAGSSFVSMVVMLVLGMRAGFRVPWADFLRIAIATAAMTLVVELTPAAHNVVTLAMRIAAGGASFAAAGAILYRRRLGPMATALLRKRDVARV